MIVSQGGCRTVVPDRVPGPPGGSPALAAGAAELAERLFVSLARRDQRRKGEQYLLGLLRARGRKSIRNIAAALAEPGAEQSLHHFISSSTWDWSPVRAALGEYLEQVDPPLIQVVQSMPIPKAGDQSVGVEQWFDHASRQVVRGQRAFGLWSVSATASVPVHWRLFLPRPWLAEDRRRRRAGIPSTVAPESLQDCVAATVTEPLAAGRRPARPVVLHVQVGELGETIARLTQARIPVIARVGGTSRMQVRDAALPGYGAPGLPAQRILASVRGLRQRTEWSDPIGPVSVRGSSLSVAVPVSVDGAELVLLGEWDEPGQSPAAMWVTNMTAQPVGALLRMTKLARRACRDQTATRDSYGLKDFEGRSFGGWHRHITLASAAHAVASVGAGRPVAERQLQPA